MVPGNGREGVSMTERQGSTAGLIVGTTLASISDPAYVQTSANAQKTPTQNASAPVLAPCFRALTYGPRYTIDRRRRSGVASGTLGT